MNEKALLFKILRETNYAPSGKQDNQNCKSGKNRRKNGPPEGRKRPRIPAGKLAPADVSAARTKRETNRETPGG